LLEAWESAQEMAPELEAQAEQLNLLVCLMQAEPPTPMLQ
jgi:hypothetical protein